MTDTVSNPGTRVLVVLDATSPPFPLVEYGTQQARDVAAEFEARGQLDVVLVHAPEESPRESLTEVEAFLQKLDTGADVETTVRAVEYTDTTALVDELADLGAEHIIVDPAVELPVDALRVSAEDADVETVPEVESGRRRRLLHPGGVRRLLFIFGLTYLFYLAIGGFTGGADLVTGAISAAVVSLSLSHVALREEPALSRTGWRFLRSLAFVPLLLWEVAKANVAIAYIILHPRLPIEPSMGTIETETEEGLEQMVLANSITLTPGTLTIDVDDREFTIHALTPGALADLEGGRLARAVAWVFHGTPEANADE